MLKVSRWEDNRTGYITMLIHMCLRYSYLEYQLQFINHRKILCSQRSIMGMTGV